MARALLPVGQGALTREGLCWQCRGQRCPFWARGRGLQGGCGRSPSHRKPASPQMKSEQRWQKVGLVSITFRKLWPSAAGPEGLAPVCSGPDPSPDPGPGVARPLLPRSGLEVGLPPRGEPPPSQARAPGSAAAAISAWAARASAAGESRVRAADERGRGPGCAPRSAPGFRQRPPPLRRRAFSGRDPAWRRVWPVAGARPGTRAGVAWGEGPGPGKAGPAGIGLGAAGGAVAGKWSPPGPGPSGLGRNLGKEGHAGWA